MIAVPLPLPWVTAPAAGLDAELADRGWAISSLQAFVMVADLPLASGRERASRTARWSRRTPSPDEAWLARVSLPRRRHAATGACATC